MHDGKPLAAGDSMFRKPANNPSTKNTFRAAHARDLEKVNKVAVGLLGIESLGRMICSHCDSTICKRRLEMQVPLTFWRKASGTSPREGE